MYRKKVTLKLVTMITSGLSWMLERFEYILSRPHIRLHIVLDALVFQVLFNSLYLGTDPLDALLDNAFHYFHVHFRVFLKI